MSAVLRREDTLPYELLLRKADNACAADGSCDETVSTAEPNSSSSSNGTAGVAAAAPAKQSVRLLRNVSIHGPHSDERLEDLIRQARVLSDVAFDEDCLREVTRKSGWKLSLLVSDDLRVLCGILVAKVAKGALSIAKLAVPREFRGLGFGKLIMDEAMKAAKKQGDVHEVCLSSLPGAVTFYQRLGFKAYKGLKLGSGDDLVEGQVYMEKRLRPRRR